ncbi:hypothetical protein KKE54_00320 [bacterium]|jgi:hypothetical protein|nr:hypothetical protein [bacterium]
MKSLFLASLLFAVTLSADYKAGEKVPPITLPDQFGKEVTLRSDDTTLIMAFEKDASVGVNEYLKTKPSAFLAEHHTKYISDISAMPTIITKLFALPKMKDYPFSLMLIYDDFGKQFNREKGKITVFQLRQGMIQSIGFISDKELPSLFAE